LTGEDDAWAEKLCEEKCAPIELENAQAFAEKLGCVAYYELSSLTRENIDGLFPLICEVATGTNLKKKYLL